MKQKKNLKEKVTVVESSVGSVGGKCRDFVVGTRREIKDICCV